MKGKDKDFIKELQLKALEIIQREGLEEEYNRFMLCKGFYYPHLPYQLIDFIIQYTEICIYDVYKDIEI